MQCYLTFSGASASLQRSSTNCLSFGSFNFLTIRVDPRILLLDEPFASLDAQTREIMQTELLSIWQKSRKTVLLITHQIDEAVFLSDRVIVFSARPGSVREEVLIKLQRPRDLKIKRTSEFVDLVDQIWKLIEEEVRLGLKDAQ